MPSAIYSAMEAPGGEMVAFRLVIVSIILSFIAMIGSEFLNRKHRAVNNLKEYIRIDADQD